MIDDIKHKKSFFELVRLLGIDGARALMTVHGGKLIYIPKMSLFFQAKRDTLIYKQYCTGRYTTKMLADKWSLAQSTIQRVIKQMALLDGRKEILSEGITILRGSKSDADAEREDSDTWRDFMGDKL